MKNLHTRRPIKKLDHVKVRLFFILKQTGLVNYQLDLPKDVKIYLVFYVLLLEPANPETLI
jgi:hypothetical protein